MATKNTRGIQVADRFLSTREVAEFLAVSTDTVRRMISEGVIRGVKIGAGRNRQVYRIRESELARLVGEGEGDRQGGQAPSLAEKPARVAGERLERFLR